VEPKRVTNADLPSLDPLPRCLTADGFITCAKVRRGASQRKAIGKGLTGLLLYMELTSRVLTLSFSAPLFFFVVALSSICTVGDHLSLVYVFD
jgi:hypothetical protein